MQTFGSRGVWVRLLGAINWDIFLSIFTLIAPDLTLFSNAPCSILFVRKYMYRVDIERQDVKR
jgi:hypothetical protein